MSELKGTNIASTIVPYTGDDTYPTHDSLYGLGGYKEVSTLAERDSIPESRLRIGCKVNVVSENKEYVYKGNGNWEESKGGVSRLSELEDVDNPVSGPSDGAVLIKQGDTWTPVSNAFLPTGTTVDGTVIKTFDDLVGLMQDISGGGDKVQRNLRILNHLDSKTLSASKGEPCFVEFTFLSQERYNFSDPYENTGERGLCQISIKNTVNTDYVVVKQMYIPSGQRIKLDISEYLTSGANNILIKSTGEVTEETTPSFVYTVQLTSLSLSASNFKWWTAYTGDILLPLNIGGNVSKTLYVTLSGDTYTQTYEIPLGTNIYVETAYNHHIPHPGTTGIYTLSCYVTNSDGSIRTRTVSFHIICAVSGSREKLITINNLSDTASNWSENTLFDYSMYDGDNVSTSAVFSISKDTDEIFSSTENNISTSTQYTFSLPLEIDTLDNRDFTIVANVSSDGTPLTPPIPFTVNNTLGYSAVAGSILYINPKTRSNRQSNRQSMINEVDGSSITATWSGVNWGNDCWTTDTLGYKVLRLLAGSAVTIHHSPFRQECARTGKTFEIDYLISNVTDFSQPIITLSSPVGDSFIGLNIYPDDVIMYSQSLKNKDVQSLHTFEEKRTRLTLTIMPDAYGNSGFNLCILYVNGIKNREFTYENNDYFAHNGQLTIGSGYADVDIYGIREYDSALTSQGAQTNYVNWLSDTARKAAFQSENDILDANGSEIDFSNTVDQYNVLVYDTTIPSLADQTSRVGTLDVYYYDHPEWNVSISNVTAKGQGTSSMKYWIWNTRYQLDKTQSVITHADGSTSTKVWQMVPGIPAGQKFTAKKNFASSMQSHKIGAVNSYTDLYRKVGLVNEAMQTEKYRDARVSVYELPFFCFEKSINDEGQPVYTFRGLYTFGPDKGDKYCFGHDTDLFPGLLAIEGSDNSPLLTLFRVPWHPTAGRVVYNEDEEAFQYNGANSWDFGAGEVSNINQWIPTYNHVYQCSPRLKPFDGTLEELNANVSTYRTQPFEYWISKNGDPDQYNVYYFESHAGRFVPSDIGEGPINLRTQLVDKGYGLTSSDLTGPTATATTLNTLFINARISKFRQEAPLYWDIDDCLFFMNNVEFNAGTDERAKNTYPYHFGTPSSKWRWRVDDADTRFDTTNRGLPDKSYSVETHDIDETGASVWNGETNNFFNLMELAFGEEKAISMRKMMIAMQELGGLKSGNDLEKIYAFYHQYYFTQAQEYFPANGYNADAKYCYENGKLAYIAGLYSNDTDPITQSLGDHYLAEQRWITKRILYMMSKYSFGLFSASGTDTITVRAAGNTITYQLTPAMDLYPAISNGTSIIKGKRTQSGTTCEMEIELSGSGDQQNAIQGASYLQDIGDWHDKNVTGSMVIQGRMLREIRLGSQTSPVTLSISSLTISNCISLQKLILSNIRTLSGALNLTSCTHLKEIHAGGTSLSQLKLPSGGGLELVEYSSQNQYVTLSNYPLLRNDGVKIDLCKSIITDFFIVDCPQIEPMRMLVDVMNAQESQSALHALKRIRAVGFNETYQSSEMLDKLAELANGSYEGLSSEGLSGEDPLPVLDGTLNVYANAYEDSIESLRGSFKKLELNVVGEFYVRFKDPIVADYFVNQFGDSVGITRTSMSSITDQQLGRPFKGNTEITSFNEFQYLTGITEIKPDTFNGCSNLREIIIPQNVKLIQYTAFRGIAIESVIIPENVTAIWQGAFEYCSNLKSVTFESGSRLNEMRWNTFYGCTSLEEIDLPDTIINSGDNNFRDCTSLRRCHYPTNQHITVIPSGEFRNCLSLQELPLTPYIKTIGPDAFHNCSSLTGHLDLSNITTMDNYRSFRGCTGIESVDVSGLVGTLGAESFAICSSLKTVIFSKSITSIGGSAFSNTAIESLDFSEYDGLELGNSCFYNCLNLKEVKLPDRCTINQAAFLDCRSLSGILVITANTIIKDGSHFYNSQLSEVILEEGQTTVTSSYNNCKLLKFVTLPSTINYISSSPFHGSSAIEWFICKAVTPPVMSTVLGYIPHNWKFYVPDGSVDAYKSASGWSQYASKIYPLSSKPTE